MQSSADHVSDRVFDIISMACSNQPMTVVNHESYKKISKGDIDVLLSKRQNVVIDRRDQSKHSVFASMEHANAIMSKSL